MKRTICKVPPDLVHLLKSDKSIIDLFNLEAFVPIQQLPKELKYFKRITNTENWGHASLNNTEKVFKASDSSFGLRRSEYPQYVFPSVIRRCQLVEPGCEPMTIYKAGYPGYLQQNIELDAVTMHLPYFTPPPSESPPKRKRNKSTQTPPDSTSISTQPKHATALGITSPPTHPTPKRKRIVSPNCESCSCQLPKHELSCRPTPKRPASATRPTPKRPTSVSRPTPKKKILQKHKVNNIAAQLRLLTGRHCRVLLHRLKLDTVDVTGDGSSKSTKIHHKISTTSPKKPRKSRKQPSNPSPPRKSRKSPVQIPADPPQPSIMEMAAASAEIELTEIEITDDEPYSKLGIPDELGLQLDQVFADVLGMKDDAAAVEELPLQSPRIKIFVKGILVNTASLDEFRI